MSHTVMIVTCGVESLPPSPQAVPIARAMSFDPAHAASMAEAGQPVYRSVL